MKQTTLRNSNITRTEDKTSFVNALTGKPFDFSSLHDEKNRTYDGLSYKNYILYSVCIHSINDKMSEIKSISGVPFNCFCDIKAKLDSYICSKCYSRTYMKMRKDLHFKNAKNEYFYSNIELKKEDIPYLNTDFFRFESFGELTSQLKVKNYFLICEINKSTFFAFFTKLPFMVDKAMKKYNICKPKNCKIIQSSLQINIIDKPMYSFIDAVFTVFDKDTIQKKGININCLKKCINCLKCYRPNETKDILYLYELLK